MSEANSDIVRVKYVTLRQGSGMTYRAIISRIIICFCDPKIFRTIEEKLRFECRSLPRSTCFIDGHMHPIQDRL